MTTTVQAALRPVASIGAAYAAPAALRGPAARLLQPPADKSVAQSAQEHRILDNPGGGISGPWRNDVAPYLVEVMESLTDGLYGTTVFVAPSQVGKTEPGLNWVVHSVAEDPADMLLVLDERQQAADFDVRRVDKLIRGTPAVSSRLAKAPKALEKHFDGMMLSIVWPSASMAASKPVPRVFMDEYDSMPLNVEGQGSPYRLFAKRTETFGASGHVYVASSPKRPILRLADNAPDPAERNPHYAPNAPGILALYNGGTRRRFYWCCPACRTWFIPDFAQLQYEPPEDKSTPYVVLSAPCCGAVLEEAQKPALNRAGHWVADGQTLAPGPIEPDGLPPTTDINSFWLTGVVPTLVSWGDLVRRYLDALDSLAKTGTDAELRTWTNTDNGRPYAPPAALGQDLDPATLWRRAEDWPAGQVPPGIRFLTAAVDVGARKFDYLVRGWGVEGESWPIARGEIFTSADGSRQLDPGSYKEDWDLLVPALLRAAWPLATEDGAPPTRALPLMVLAIDTGGAPGVTGQAYAAWRRWRAAGIAAGTLMMIKGASTAGAPALRRTKFDEPERGHHLAPVDGWILGVDRLKDETFARLQRDQPGPGHVHIPLHWLTKADRDKGAQVPTALLELCGERRVDGKWLREGRRQETWDLFVYTEAAFQRLDGHKTDWSRPPLWATDPHAPDTRNPMVRPIGVTAPLTPLLSPPSAAAPGQPQRPLRPVRGSSLAQRHAARG